MEKALIAGEQRISFDRDVTVALYRQIIRVPGAESCACIYCKNFTAQRRKVFPSEFVTFLESLGVDPTKEWEAFEYDFDAKNPQNPVLYGGWFLFAGELMEGLELDKNPPPLQQGFAHWFTTSFPSGMLPTDLKLCAVQFLARIPWVLPEIPE